jgi:peptide/nickel transport system substrate-binding protein
MEWDIPYEPNLISQVELYTPPYREIAAVRRRLARVVHTSKGAKGEEPPAWAKRLYELEGEWRTIAARHPRYMEIGREMVKINLENMTIIGTVANLPKPTVVSRKLANVRDWTVQHYNYARTYPFRADQWYYKHVGGLRGPCFRKLPSCSASPTWR